MNSFIASSAGRDLQRTLHVRYVWARARTFKAMLAEFHGEEKRKPVWRKGLFFQDKTAEPGTVRDNIPAVFAKWAGIVRAGRARPHHGIRRHRELHQVQVHRLRRR